MTFFLCLYYFALFSTGYGNGQAVSALYKKSGLTTDGGFFNGTGVDAGDGYGEIKIVLRFRGYGFYWELRA